MQVVRNNEFAWPVLWLKTHVSSFLMKPLPPLTLSLKLPSLTPWARLPLVDLSSWSRTDWELCKTPTQSLCWSMVKLLKLETIKNWSLRTVTTPAWSTNNTSKNKIEQIKTILFHNLRNNNSLHNKRVFWMKTRFRRYRQFFPLVSQKIKTCF